MGKKKKRTPGSGKGTDGRGRGAPARKRPTPADAGEHRAAFGRIRAAVGSERIHEIIVEACLVLMLVAGLVAQRSSPLPRVGVLTITGAALAIVVVRRGWRMLQPGGARIFLAVLFMFIALAENGGAVRLPWGNGLILTVPVNAALVVLTSITVMTRRVVSGEGLASNGNLTVWMAAGALALLLPKAALNHALGAIYQIDRRSLAETVNHVLQYFLLFSTLMLYLEREKRIFRMTLYILGASGGIAAASLVSRLL